jgi:alkyldihydroxyacetonephosphate synthase
MTRSWWGWGTTDRALPDEECVALAAMLPGLPDRPRAVPRTADLVLPRSRVSPPTSLPVSTDPGVRAAHTYGKAYRDVVRALLGDLRTAPDAVALPGGEDDVVRLLDWAGSAVGRDHRPGYDRQRPEPFAVALRAVKASLDPAGLLNPGVLVDPV